MDLHAGSLRIRLMIRPKIAVFLLLNLVQRLIEHLQLQRLLHIGAIPEPENQFITGINTFLALSGPVIKKSQLKRPFLGIFLFFQLLQQGDPLTELRPLRLHHFITKHISLVIMGRDIHKLIIVFLRLFKILRVDRQLCQPVNDHAPDRGTVVCGQQHLPRVIVALYLLISLTRLKQGVDVPDFFPVNLVAKICGLRIFLLTYELL